MLKKLGSDISLKVRLILSLSETELFTLKGSEVCDNVLFYLLDYHEFQIKTPSSKDFFLKNRVY